MAAAQGAGRVLIPAPDGLKLDVGGGAEKKVRPLVLELVEALDDGDLGTTQLVALERLHKEPLEGFLQISRQINALLVRRDRRRGRDNEIRLVAEGGTQLRRDLRRGLQVTETTNRRELFLDG